MKKKIWAGMVIIALVAIVCFIGSVARTISDTQDNKDTLIRNSKGHYWEPIGSNIQVAINDLGQQGGTVWLPAGTLVPTARINLKSNVRLVGMGMGVTIIKAESAYDSAMIRTSSGERQHNITVSDLTIDGNDVMGNCLYLHSVTDYIVENVYVKDSTSNGMGIFGGCDRGIVSSCKASGITGASYEGFAINSAKNSVFSDWIAWDIGGSMAVDFHTIYNCTVSNILVYDSVMGMKFFGDVGEKGGNNVVSNLNFFNIDDAGLWIKREYNSSFSNINVEAGTGIVLDGSSNINLNNFYIENNGDGGSTGLHFSSHIHGCERVNIKNGIIHTTGLGRGLYASDLKDVSFSNLQVYGSANYNRIADSQGVTVSDSTFANGNERGLIMSNCQEFTITGCRLVDNAIAGIWVFGSYGPCTDFVISDNIIQGNSEGIRVDAFAHDSYIITNNVLTDNTGQGLRDQSTGSNKFTGDNLT